MIEKASIEDIPQLCDLLEMLFDMESDFLPDRTKQTEGLKQIIGNPEVGCILVFREGNDICGMVNLLYTVSTACGGRVAMLEDLIVKPEQRGMKIGSSLLDAAIDHARTSGCLRITLLTDSGNLGAIRLYHRFGFSRSDMIPLRLFP